MQLFAILFTLLVFGYCLYNIVNSVEPDPQPSTPPQPNKAIKYSGRQLSEEELDLKSLSREAYEKKYSGLNKDFVNKNCTGTHDFIINDKINAFDIFKLAEINGIGIEFQRGWYKLVIAMMQELDARGWDRKVSCMKEKWGSLRFYTASAFDDITDKYQELSEHVCEICGEPGNLRTHGWFYVACRKHYNEGRGRVDLTSNGFNYDGDVFEWNDIRKMYFTEVPYSNGARLLYFDLKIYIRFIGELPVFRMHEIGFGKFVRNVPSSIRGLDRDYIHKNYPDALFCEVCGYKAVYNNRCECCEKEQWSGLDPASYWRKRGREPFLAMHQLDWKKEEGDFYESQHTTYLKNPEHKIYFAPEQLEKYEKGIYDD